MDKNMRDKLIREVLDSDKNINARVANIQIQNISKQNEVISPYTQINSNDLQRFNLAVSSLRQILETKAIISRSNINDNNIINLSSIEQVLTMYNYIIEILKKGTNTQQTIINMKSILMTIENNVNIIINNIKVKLSELKPTSSYIISLKNSLHLYEIIQYQLKKEHFYEITQNDLLSKIPETISHKVSPLRLNSPPILSDTPYGDYESVISPSLQSPEKATYEDIDEPINLPDDLDPELVDRIDEIQTSDLGRKVLKQSLKFGEFLREQIANGINNATENAQNIQLYLPYILDGAEIIRKQTSEFLLNHPEIFIAYCVAIAELYLQEPPTILDSENTDIESEVRNHFINIISNRLKQGIGIAAFRSFGLTPVFQKFAEIAYNLINKWQEDRDLPEMPTYERPLFPDTQDLQQQQQASLRDTEEQQPAQRDIFEFKITPENRHLLGPRDGLRADGYVEAINAYNLAHPDAIIDISNIRPDHYGGKNLTYMRVLSYNMEGKIQVRDTINNKIVPLIK